MIFKRQQTVGRVKEIRIVVKHAHLLPPGDWHTLEAEATRDVGGGEDWERVMTQLTQEVRQQVEAYFPHFRQQPGRNGNGRKGKEHPVTAFWRYVYTHDIPQSRARAVVDRCQGDFRRALAEIQNADSVEAAM